MGACQSSQDGDEEEKKKRSRLIDAKLLEDERRLKKECKILLLGTKELLLNLDFFWMLGFLCWPQTGSGESGKSTIVKQMKIIHQNGYTKDELALYRLTIYKNVIDCAKALVGAMRMFHIEPVNPQNNENCDFLMAYQVDPDPHSPLDPRVGTAVISLWRDACIAEIMEHQSEFYLMDSAP